MKPHKYKDLIIAWANGAEIQVKYDIKDEWINWDDSDSPSWHENFEYRIKPEPKPDYVRYIGINNGSIITTCLNDCFNTRHDNNIQVVMDGETGKPKEVRLI